MELSITCALCARPFANTAGLAIHKGLVHKLGYQSELDRIRVASHSMKLERQSAAKKRREEDEAQEAKSNSVADTGHAIGAALNAELLMHATNLRLDYHCPQVAASASKDMVNMTIQMCGEAMKQAWRVNPQMSEAGIGNVMQQLNDSLRSIDTPEKERAELHKGLGSAFISPVHRSLGVSAAYPEGKSRCVDMPLIPMLERLFRWCASLTRTLTLTLTLTLTQP